MRTGNPDWVKGVSPNPKGRPKGSKNRFSLSDLQKALDKAKAKHKGVSLLDHICSRAYESDIMAIAILKKMLPDLKQVEAAVDVALGGFAAMSPDEAAIQMDAATVGKKPKVKAKKKAKRKSK